MSTHTDVRPGEEDIASWNARIDKLNADVDDLVAVKNGPPVTEPCYACGQPTTKQPSVRVGDEIYKRVSRLKLELDEFPVEVVKDTRRRLKEVSVRLVTEVYGLSDDK